MVVSVNSEFSSLSRLRNHRENIGYLPSPQGNIAYTVLVGAGALIYVIGGLQ